MPHSRLASPCGLGDSRASDLAAWLGRAQPGDRVVYRQGSLVFDRGSTSSLQRRESRRIDDLATAAHPAAAAGRVHLVQERVAVGTFPYLAVRAFQKSCPQKILNGAIEGTAARCGWTTRPFRETTP
jgi:hypothetical protein